MQLTRITIEDLRAIRRFDVDLSEPSGLPRRRLVLLGVNGSGKTTILDAVGHAFQVLGASGVVDGDDELGARFLGAGDVRSSGPAEPTLDETQRHAMIRIEAFLPEPDQVLQRSRRRRHGQVTFPVGGELDGLRFIGRLPTRFQAEPDFADDVRSVLVRARPPCVLLPANRGALEEDERAGVLLENVMDFEPRRDCLAKGRARFAPLAARLALAYLGGEGADPEGRVKRMWKALERYVPDLPRPIGVKGLRLWFENADGSAVPLSALSDGQRAMLLLFGELALRVPEHGVVMIDDVEQYLHPRWQLAALEGLPALVPTAQFIFATQSPYVAASAPDDVIEVGDWKRDGE